MFILSAPHNGDRTAGMDKTEEITSLTIYVLIYCESISSLLFSTHSVFL